MSGIAAYATTPEMAPYAMTFGIAVRDDVGWHRTRRRSGSYGTR